MNVRGTLISFRGGTVRNHSMYSDVILDNESKTRKKKMKIKAALLVILDNQKLAYIFMYAIQTFVCNNANKLYERRAGNCVTWVHNF